MRARSLLFASTVVLSGIASGCGESAAGPALTPAETELVGRWIGPRNDLSPAGWHQSTLTFTVDGHFASENRMHGRYDGQSRDELSVVSRTEGSYRIAGDRLIFDPQRLVWWDRFYGAQSAEHVEEPYPWGSIFDDARYSVSADRLTMSFTVYPADAPVPAVGEYTRDR